MIFDDPKQYRNFVELSLLARNQTFFVFEKNYEELNKKLLFTDDLQEILEFFCDDNFVERDNHKDEIIRLLHNFLASAKTLVEFNRNIMKWFKGTEIFDQYEKIIENEFSHDPVVGFIDELRNYCLHYALPVTYAHFLVKFTKEYSLGEYGYQFLLVKKLLLQWNSWTKKSEPFLLQSDDDIIIDDICSHYFKLAKGLHDWNVKTFQSLLEKM